MSTSDDLTMCVGWSVACNVFDSCVDFERQAVMAENYRTFQSFICSLAPLQVFNPLPILARAINRVKRGPTLKQPRWKRGRWRSKT